MPHGPERMNRCMERGAPRVPVLFAQGGDSNITGEFNPRADWTRDTIQKIEDGSLKRIKYWNNNQEENTEIDSIPRKRRRTDPPKTTTTGEQQDITNTPDTM